MSDLNDFFAKKDKRKKKPAKADSANGSAAVGAGGQADKQIANSAGGGALSAGTAGQKPSVSGRGNKDDGWIELDENKSVTVNTGGRTVADFNKRETDEKEANGGGDALTEKFSGWTVGDKEGEGEGEGEESEGPPAEVGAAPVASYPSLADTADAPEVPKNAGPGGGGYVTRKRYGNSGGGGFAALKKKLEEMRASEGAPAGGAPSPAPASAARSGSMTLKEKLAAMREEDAAK